MPSLTHLSRQFDAVLNQFKAMDLGMSDAERYPSGLGCGYDPKKKTYPSIYLSGPKDEFAELPDSGEAVIKYQVTRRSTEEENGKKRHSLTLEVRSIDPAASKKAAEEKKAEGRAVAIATMSNGEGRMTNFAGGYHRDEEGGIRKQKGVLAHLKRNAVTYAGTPLAPIGWVAGAAVDRLYRRPRNLKKSAKESPRKGDGARVGGVLPDGRVSTEFNRPRDGDGQFVANVTGGADPVTMRQAYGPDPKKSKLLAPGAAAAALAGTGLLGTKAGRVMAIKGAKGASRMVRSAVTGIDRKLKGRSTERYPVMGSKAPKGKPGLGETLMRQQMRGD